MQKETTVVDRSLFRGAQVKSNTVVVCSWDVYSLGITKAKGKAHGIIHR